MSEVQKSEDSTKKSAGEIGEQSSESAPNQQPTQSSDQQPSEGTVRQTSEAPDQQPSEAPDQQPSEAPVQQPSEPPVKQSSEQSLRKSVGSVSKKSSNPPKKEKSSETIADADAAANDAIDDAFDFFGFNIPDTPEEGSEYTLEEEEEVEEEDTGPRKITPKLLKDTANELGIINLCWPETQIPPGEDEEKEFSISCYENSNKEKLLLLYAENFREQFHFTFPDRKPLLLAADNECGLQKMVCTTIRPTRLPFPELSNWEGCARFVADHLVYKPLLKPTRFPVEMASPTHVLKHQEGNCFEYSTVLCSLLSGIGYDAYVVSGYATKELCEADQSRRMNPELLRYAPVEEIKEPVTPKKYEMKLSKEFVSQYLRTMVERAQDEIAAKKEDLEAREDIKILLSETLAELPEDDLFGVRVHSWVLVRPGSLGIEEAFFIDPPTGRSFSPDNPIFLGLESLWNNANYWINLQDCSEGCRQLKFDLKDPICWNWMLLGEPWYMRETTEEESEDKSDEEQEEDDDEKEAEAEKKLKEKKKYLVEKHLDMPASWVSKLEVSEEAYKKRYPGGSKIIKYHHSKVFYYAPYIKKDGLLMRIITYSDNNYEDKLMVYEIYKNRVDLLTDVVEDYETQLVSEKYLRGREEGTKEHQYYMDHTDVEDKRTLTFYYESRADCLEELIMDPLYLTLKYKDRLDFLYYRHAVFEPRKEGESHEAKRKVLSLLEKFHRNPEKNNEEDIAERTFLPPQNKILLKFHYGDSKIVASTREFIKPPPEKLGDKLKYDPRMTVGFNVDPTYPSLKPHQLFELFLEQYAAEEQAFLDLRGLEDELYMFLQLRIDEVEVPKLSVNIYDTERNEDAKEEMLEQEKKMKEQTDKEYVGDVDYLAPYLARLGLTNNALTQKEALQVRDLCLNDHKNIYVTRANNMQEAFERTCNTLRVKHYWYEQQRDLLTKEEEEEYFEQCNQLRFYLHTLEIRLKRHRDIVPQKFAGLELWLQKDPRLAILYN